VALGFLALFLVVPLLSVFFNAFAKGAGVFARAIVDPVALSAIKLTFLSGGHRGAGQFGFWAWRRPGPSRDFGFPGRNFLITLIDLPFSVSPVISGMVFV
jgi:sulfate transport system permease protein